MNLMELVNALEGARARTGAPTDARGHEFDAVNRTDNRCTRCTLRIPDRLQYTKIECAGRATTLDEASKRVREQDTKPVAAPRVK